MEFIASTKSLIERQYRIAQIYLLFTTLLVPSIHPILSSNLSIKIPQYKITEMQTSILLPFFIFIIVILGYHAILSKKTDLTMRDLWIADIIALIASFLLSVIIALPTSLVGAASFGISIQQPLFIALIIVITAIIGWSLIIIPGELKE